VPKAISRDIERVSASYSGSVRPCPVCEGRVYLTAQEQYIDPPCPCCGGTNTVDIEKFCNCGRPIVWEYKGFLICASKACHDAVDKHVEAAKEKKTIVEKAKLLPEDDDESEPWWNRFHGLF